ncbi:protein mesh-like [Babylonia areolata]|uniref:protein mesh-like n=1 Tax=Babylonia areolata TaxID=304850 RepID=UPI003FD5D11F
MMYVDASVTSFCRVLSLTLVPRRRPFLQQGKSTSLAAVLFVVLLFSGLLSPTMSLSLYPFGQQAGDAATKKSDDGGSGVIILSKGFTFYGKEYNKLYVNNNGVISFLQELRGYRPKTFPLEEDTPIIAPFWADVDVDKVGGTVWYRESRAPDVLARASEDVHAYSSQFKRFRARWAFVATWDNVGFYGASELGKRKRNTFQSVLVTDGRQSFAVFLYQKLEWTTGSNSKGNSDTGLGGHPAQAGFNAGDGDNYHTVDGAGEDRVINLTQTTNICFPGKWLFRVDSPQIVRDSGTLLLAPSSGSMLGGFLLAATGPCLSSSSSSSSGSNANANGNGNARLVQGLIVDTGDTFPCSLGGSGEEGSNSNSNSSSSSSNSNSTSISSNSSSSSSSSRTVHCVVPSVFVVGEVTVTLLLDGVRLNYTGVFTFVNPGLTKPQVTRHAPQAWVADRRVRLSWQPSSSGQSWLFSAADQDTVLVDVLTFRETSGVPRLETDLSETVSVPSSPSSKVELTLPSMRDATLAVVRIRVAYPLIDGSYISYWSDVFPVRWAGATRSQAWCSRWLSRQQEQQGRGQRGQGQSGQGQGQQGQGQGQPELACPCTERQAESDTGRWQRDWLCSSQSTAQCIYRGSRARQCFVSTFNRTQTLSSLCCYDERRELLNLGEGGGGSMAERLHLSAPQGGGGGGGAAEGEEEGERVVPWFSYLAEEVAPFLHCCDYASNASLCREFVVHRPQLSCQGYSPPAAAQAAGDPHLVTLDGVNYTFNGEGDFVLLQDRTHRLRVHVHAARALDLHGQLGNATLFTAVAVGVVNETGVVEIRRGDDQETASVLVDQQEVDLDSSPLELRGITLYHNDTANGTVDFTVVMETAGISVLVSATPDLLNIMVLVGSSQLKGNLEGLLGNYNGVKTDDLRSRQGRVIPVTANMSDIHYLFGMTWHLERNESLLYHPEDEDSSGDQSGYVPVFMDTIKEDELRNGTLELCQGNQQCIFDFQLTGKESIGQSTKQFNDRFETVVKEIAPVVRCPYIQQLDNGNRTLDGQAVGNRVTFTCDQGYRLTNGTTVLVCQDSGKWNGTAPDCVIDLRQDKEDILLYIAVGSAFGGFVVVILSAVLLLWAIRKCRRKYMAKMAETGSEPEQIELPRFFDPSSTPNPVFENPHFLSSLQKLKSEEGRFQIPRPRYVDPNIYTEYF